VDDGTPAGLEIRTLASLDLEPVSRVHLAAFTGTLGASLGRRYVEAMFRWYLLEPGAVSLVGQQGEAIVGYVFGAPSGHWDRFNRAMAPTVLGSFLRRPGNVLHPHFLRKIPIHLRSVLGPRTRRDEWGAAQQPSYDLCGIGVAPSFRQQGIAARLIEQFEEHVWSAGFESIVLSVHAGNQAARRLYEGRSWRITSEDEYAAYYRLTRAKVTPLARGTPRP
jgi:ribosomal protein S18 acetylase RimI-like enzyme